MLAPLKDAARLMVLAGQTQVHQSGTSPRIHAAMTSRTRIHKRRIKLLHAACATTRQVFSSKRRVFRSIKTSDLWFLKPIPGKNQRTTRDGLEQPTRTPKGAGIEKRCRLDATGGQRVLCLCNDVQLNLSGDTYTQITDAKTATLRRTTIRIAKIRPN